LFFLLISVLGKGTTVETAFLILIDMSLLIYFIPYLYLFACFTVHCRRRSKSGENKLMVPGGAIGALIMSVCGLSVTLLAMIVATIPPAGTTNIWLHEVKLVGGSFVLVAIGLVIYWRAKRAQGRRFAI